MGFWVCEDFDGMKFDNEMEIKDFLRYELTALADREFSSWLEDNYSVHQLYYAFTHGKSEKDLFMKCREDIWNANNDLCETLDGNALDHRFVWVGGGSMDRKKKKSGFKWPKLKIRIRG